jgi:hypothetical protein
VDWAGGAVRVIATRHWTLPVERAWDDAGSVTTSGIAPHAPHSASERRALLDALEDPRDWPPAAAALVAELGFRLVQSDRMADDASHLLVALRGEPTLEHFDPESIAYYAPSDAVASLVTLDRAALRDHGDGLARRVLWGHVHVFDRVPVENRFLTFGGHLRIAQVDASLAVIDLWSPAPIVRWGGHSQATDTLAAAIGAFFGRLMVAVDFVPGAAERVDAVLPEVLYHAFLIEASARSRKSILAADPSPTSLDAWLRAACGRARLDTRAFAAADRLRRDLQLSGAGSPSA